MNNWLCNLTGEEGRWFPMDLFLEHNINLLKSMSGHRDTPFGAQFFSEIISLNIRHFLEVKESMRSSVGIGVQGGRHQKKKKVVAMKVLAQTMREQELHKFRATRTYGFVAQDDFTAGYNRFDSTSRIADFVKRTLADGSLHDIDDNDNAEVEENPVEPASQPPQPPVWCNGELVLSDDEFESEDEDLSVNIIL